ncbi:hypothetical protein EZS27_038157, partial [termite gut metagenome]
HGDEAISVDPSEVSFASEGETKEVEVTATGDYSFTGGFHAGRMWNTAKTA